MNQLIKNACKKKDIAPGELAEKMKIHRATLWRKMNHLAAWTLPELLLLAKILDLEFIITKTGFKSHTHAD